MNWFKQIWNSIITSNDKPFIDEIVQLKEKVSVLSEINEELEIKQGEYKQQLIDFEKTFQTLFEQETELDKYCSKNFKKIAPIAYKQKRQIEGLDYTINLQELITPNSWEVHNLIKGIDRDNGTTKDITKRIGDRVAEYIKWDSDNNLYHSGDYYLYPSETIIRKKGDCEDHAFVVCSTHEEIGGAWGFLYDGGHAFNVFVFDDNLYILDTVGDKAFIEKYTDRSHYKIYFIITRKNVYRVNSGTTFGQIAQW